MLWWDSEFLNVLQKVNMKIDMYARFKDDINEVCDELNEKNDIIENIWNLDCMRHKSKPDLDTNFTANVMCELANGIDPMISFTVDTCDKNQDKKLPMLDVKVYLDENQRLIHDHFEKSTKNKRVILASSALSWAQKRTIHTQECLRIMRNTSVFLGEKIQNENLNFYMKKLMYSGYNAKFRGEVIKSAKNAYRKILVLHKEGKNMYRNRKEMQECKVKKQKNKENWWQSQVKGKKPFTSILFVPPTPRGELAKMLKKREMELNQNNEMNIRIVERGGPKMKHILVQKNPFPPQKCKISFCPFCNEDENIEICSKNKFQCSSFNVGYSIKCKSCNSVYHGETSRRAAVRAIEHCKDLKREKEESPLVKHLKLKHPEGSKFTFQVTGQFFNALTRQADESVRIQSSAQACLNSKAEFNGPKLARISLEKT